MGRAQEDGGGRTPARATPLSGPASAPGPGLPGTVPCPGAQAAAGGTSDGTGLSLASPALWTLWTEPRPGTAARAMHPGAARRRQTEGEGSPARVVVSKSRINGENSNRLLNTDKR